MAPRDPLVTLTSDNAAVRQALENGTANIAAGTSWLWSRADMAAAVHVLFVDEAGQMSLANVLASAPASNGIILLGDPQQLDQPEKGVTRRASGVWPRTHPRRRGHDESRTGLF